MIRLIHAAQAVADIFLAIFDEWDPTPSPEVHPIDWTVRMQRLTDGMWCAQIQEHPSVVSYGVTPWLALAGVVEA